MRKRSRLFLMTCGGLTWLVGLTLVLMVMTAFASLSFRAGPVGSSVAAGALIVRVDSDWGGPFQFVVDTPYPHWIWLPEVVHQKASMWQPTPGILVVAPLWLIAMVLAIPSVLLWRVLLRRRSARACPNCDYDRSGLTRDTACPECGEKP